MSLIDEALKRAELAAARRDGLRTGASPWAMESRPRRRRGWLLAALLVLLVAAGGGAFWLIRRSVPASEKPPAPAAGQSALQPPNSQVDMKTVEVPPPPPVVKPRDPGRQEAESKPAASADSSRPSARAAEPPSARTVPAGSARSAPPAPESRPPAPAAVAAEGKSARGLANGRTYIGEVSIPDGGKIALEGIVYSEANPIALVNGKVLPPGAVVEEFTIVSIQPDRVELKGRGVTIFIALK